MKKSSGCLRIIGMVLGFVFCFNGVCASLASKGEKGILLPAVCLFCLGVFLFWISRRKPAKYSDKDIYLSKEQICRLEKNQEIPVIQTPLLLNPGETAIFYCKATKQEAQKQIIGKEGGYGGVSFRIAKGLTIHSGKIASTPVYGDVYSHFPGAFIMTTHRLVFINDQKGFEVPYETITAFQCYADGIFIQIKNVTHILLLPRPDLINILFSEIRNVGVEKFAEKMTQHQQSITQGNLTNP